MLDRIRRRLTLAYAGILALVLILFGAIVVVSFSQQLTVRQDELLAQKAEAEASSLLDGTGSYGRIEATVESDIALAAVPPEDSMDANFLEVESSTSSLGLPFREQARRSGEENTVLSRTLDGPGGPVRVVSVPLLDDSGEVLAVVQAAQSRQAVRETVERLVLVLVFVGLGGIFLAGAGGLYISRRAMRPVREAFDRQRTFVANASHELKTPLALVKLHTEVMKRDPSNPENSQIMDKQLSEIDRINALVSDLLFLARLDAGKLDVQVKPFDLSAVLIETASRFHAKAIVKEIQLEPDLPSELPARGDPERTAQIAAALLDNALRYTPAGGRIDVTGRLIDGRVEATVTDGGPGIDPTHLPRVFDRFYRAETARTRNGGGTGLGLTIARDLARAQGGELSASDTAQEGATFTLRLPAGS